MRLSILLLFFIFQVLNLSKNALGKPPPELEKQIIYLSGTDNEHTKTWDFYCTGGRNSGYWTTIEVPSCWEQQGFGNYNYGRDYHTYGKGYRYHNEKGFYKYKFTVPLEWKNKEVWIIFEGSMTDTEVLINGQEAGEIHQGAFYRFSFNISKKINYGASNILEVNVKKESSQKCVNYAERKADYWIFGGIFRQVYLQALPAENISYIEIDGQADGYIRLRVHRNKILDSRNITAQVIDPKGNPVKEIKGAINAGESSVILEGIVSNPQTWTSETPVLYSLKLKLKEGTKTLHSSTEIFGFRTIEVRHGDGVYINGRKIKFKGINRHAFWPETGRTLNREIDRMDVKLTKEMNMNAVRCSHYPPDKSFLEICDSLGLYVINELAGWHYGYNTDVGEKLVKEMVMRDVNHPSIIFWSNGNEGGHNKDLDDDFLWYDLSQRPVIHAHHKPGHAFNGIDCNHYENYYSMQKILKDSLIYMPTEFLHCQNDGGAGGLYDFWKLMRNSPKSAGGFQWAFLDEGVVRTDLGGVIDVNGVNAQDGVVGPYRQKEGSFFAIKDIYSPVVILDHDLPTYFKGTLQIENRFDFTNLAVCDYTWKLVCFNLPTNTYPGYNVIESGKGTCSNIEPGEKGKLSLNLPPDWQESEALIIEIQDPSNRIIYSRTFPIGEPQNMLAQYTPAMDVIGIEMTENDTSVNFNIHWANFRFSKKSGQLIFVSGRNRNKYPFKNGPVLCSGKAEFEKYEITKDKDNYIFTAYYSGDLKKTIWTIYPSGLLELQYTYSLKGEYLFAGISFDYPEGHVMSVKYLGDGPFRVWKNRLQGVSYNVYEKSYNNTTTGEYPRIYPEFKGYYSNVAWMEFITVDGKFYVSHDGEDLFVRLFDFYGLPGIQPQPPLPVGDISFLDCIPPIGTKMSKRINTKVHLLGPQSQLNKINTTITRTLTFYFRNLDK